MSTPLTENQFRAKQGRGQKEQQVAPVTTGVIGANPPSLLARVGQGQRAFEGRVPLGGVDSGRFTDAGSGFAPKRATVNRKHLRPLLCGRNVFERNSSGRAG